MNLQEEYNRLKQKLTPNVGQEESSDEVMWNDGILEAIDNLFLDVPDSTKQSIILNHI